jgi:hypothetical protein
MVIARIAVALAGVYLILATFGSAVRTVVLPRGRSPRITRNVFVVMRRLFRLRIGPRPTYERTDSVLAPYAPVSLITLVFVWLAIVFVGYAAAYWGSGRSVTDSIVLSGSSLTTLGFERPDALGWFLVVLSEAAVGLVIVALLITYLPSIYAAFSRREAMVASLETRAGVPPSAEALVIRVWAIEWLDKVQDFWPAWEAWFIDLQETHTTFPSLAFFRSPQPEQSWVTTAGAMLDTASFMASTIDRPRDPAAELLLRSGYIALRRIAGVLIPRATFPSDPRPTDPISIARAEYDEAVDRLAAAGVPLVDDRDLAWKAFNGWRVNYDAVLLGLARVTDAPYAPWISDRSVLTVRPR